MTWNRRPLAAVTILAAALGLAGCAGLGDGAYAAVEEGARQALSATYSLSADVANWLAEPPETGNPPCAAAFRG
jgi:hypothetical protein